jgi:hypothetical protein
MAAPEQNMTRETTRKIIKQVVFITSPLFNLSLFRNQSLISIEVNTLAY